MDICLPNGVVWSKRCKILAQFSLFSWQKEEDEEEYSWYGTEADSVASPLHRHSDHVDSCDINHAGGVSSAIRYAKSAIRVRNSAISASSSAPSAPCRDSSCVFPSGSAATRKDII